MLNYARLIVMESAAGAVGQFAIQFCRIAGSIGLIAIALLFVLMCVGAVGLVIWALYDLFA